MNEFQNNITTNESIGTCIKLENTISYINSYVVPSIAMFGLFGNFLAATIFLRSKLNQRSSSVYLGTLSIADFGYLVIVQIAYLAYNNISDLYNTDILCQSFIFISSVCSNLSVWLIVAFTIERFIAVKYPLKRPLLCTVSRAKIITLTIFIISLISQIHTFWTAGLLIEPDGKLLCELLPQYTDFMRIINYIDTITTFILPVCIIVSLNTMIARALIAFRENLFTPNLTTRSSDSYNSSGADLNMTSRYESTDDSIVSCVRYQKGVLMTRCQRNITKMLLLVSSIFILLNTPSYILRLLAYTFETVLERPVPMSLSCIQIMLQPLFYLNHSINFLLYSMYGAAFRQALVCLIRTKFESYKRSIIGSRSV